MFDNKIIKWVIKILCVGLLGYAVVLLIVDDNGKILSDSEQEYVTAAIDSNVQVYQVRPHNYGYVQTDTLNVTNMPNVVAVNDSNSATRFNLYREEQEVVTIDLEDHTEKVFFTWDDIKSYYQATLELIKKRLNKNQHNDSN